jgi:hypothetical protein
MSDGNFIFFVRVAKGVMVRRGRLSDECQKLVCFLL